MKTQTYLERLADEVAKEVPASKLPDEDTRELFLLYGLLARCKGAATARHDVHDAWVAWMVLRGETHPAMVPFDELPSSVQAEDSPFVEAIRRVSARHVG